MIEFFLEFFLIPSTPSYVFIGILVIIFCFKIRFKFVFAKFCARKAPTFADAIFAVVLFARTIQLLIVITTFTTVITVSPLHHRLSAIVLVLLRTLIRIPS